MYWLMVSLMNIVGVFIFWICVNYKEYPLKNESLEKLQSSLGYNLYTHWNYSDNGIDGFNVFLYLLCAEIIAFGWFVSLPIVISIILIILAIKGTKLALNEIVPKVFGGLFKEPEEL